MVVELETGHIRLPLQLVEIDVEPADVVGHAERAVRLDRAVEVRAVAGEVERLGVGDDEVAVVVVEDAGAGLNAGPAMSRFALRPAVTAKRAPLTRSAEAPIRIHDWVTASQSWPWYCSRLPRPVCSAS